VHFMLSVKPAGHGPELSPAPLQQTA